MKKYVNYQGDALKKISTKNQEENQNGK